MRKIILTVFLATLLYFANAQDTLQNNQTPHTIGAKVLFIDYGTPNNIDNLDLTNGIELQYNYNFNRWLNVAIPLKAGVINVKDDINNRNFFGLDAVLQLNLTKPGSLLVPYLLGGGGYTFERDGINNFQAPVGAGLNVRVGKSAFINVQGEYRFSNETDRNNLQAGAGILYRLGKGQKDTDKDGIPDLADGCPTRPGPKETQGCPDKDKDGVADKMDACPTEPGTPATNGCPDNDKDGIANKDDQCPDEAGTSETKGCPDKDKDSVIDKFDDCPDQAGPASNKGCPILDDDGDGVPNDMDKCPTEKGSPAAMGCPDRDGDGVLDKDDRCPDKAGRLSGCPDSDGDGLADPDDACPTEAGTAANRGCPELKEEVKQVLEFAMRAIQFETGRSTLKAESYPVLDQIVQIMKQYPAYSLRISGHTDNVGAASTNQLLSEMRAKTCYEYLAASGIDINRMSYNGYGESRPISSNNTAEGKRLNRRTEFELYIK